MTDDDVHWIPILVRSNVTEWERGFLVSLIAQTRSGRRMSEKQAGILRKIKQQFQAETMRDEPLIEGDNDNAE